MHGAAMVRIPKPFAKSEAVPPRPFVFLFAIGDSPPGSRPPIAFVVSLFEIREPGGCVDHWRTCMLIAALPRSVEDDGRSRACSMMSGECRRSAVLNGGVAHALRNDGGAVSASAIECLALREITRANLSALFPRTD
ncbi:hypothetical protein HYPP_00928 [Hyphomicrobium sp. ghe19]|nr:hypothetical protein HYPP_00928 [Hyphomicrobium sp. ghe19]